jgi:acyl carrier protein
MTKSEILVALTGIFRDVLDDETIVLKPETTARDIPQWDSMSNISIMVEVERRFKMKFKTAELEEMRNVGELAAVIEKRSAKAQA